MTRTRAALVLGFAALVLSACGSSSPTAATTPAPIAPALEAIVFAFPPEVSAFTTIGATVQVTALGVFSRGPTRDLTSTCTQWLSDAPGVVTVTSGGLLTAQRTSGAATITTTCQSVGARGLVTINPPLSPIVPGTPAVEHGPPPGAHDSTCVNPPYHFDTNPLVLRCREDKSGQFAKNECCGLPPAGAK